MSGNIAGYIDHPTGRWYFACCKEGLIRAGNRPMLDMPELNDHPLVKKHAAALLEMLDGTTDQYTLPMVYEGTDFQQKVWQKIAAIPFGQTKSYADIAHELGGKATRAVGTACGANKLGIAIPCHRVIRSDGRLGGYGLGGLEVKQRLLDFEAGDTRQKAA